MVAVEEFIAGEAPRTIASNGQRAQLSAKYAYGRAIMLRRFAAAFSGSAVGDLGKHDLDSFMTSKAVAAFSAKSRNHHRAVIKQLLEWAARKDYLAQGHRLLEADALRPEHANTAEVQFYTAEEFRGLLETATGPLRAMIALGGLAGLRTQELLRLSYEDLWRVPGHVEVTALKSKTRSRRLVKVVPALAAWLKPFLDLSAGSRKKNGLRHSFCSFHFALHGNENLTAQQAGHAPAMTHSAYKGLATKKEAAAWFAVRPTGKTITPTLKETAA